MIGHVKVWEQTIIPLCVLIGFAHEYIDRLKKASKTRLDSFVSDLKLNKCLLYHNVLERHQIKYEFTIKSEEGPHGRERLTTLQQDYKDPRSTNPLNSHGFNFPD